MRKYIEVIDDLSECLNFKSTDEQKAKQNKRVFNCCLTELKEDFKTDVSTKFLMGFVIGDNKQKSNRVTYLLKQIGLNETLKISDYYMDLTPQMIEKDAEVTIYSSKIKEDKTEKFFIKVLPMTSHDLNGVCRPCKVGITTFRRVKTPVYNQIVL